MASDDYGRTGEYPSLASQTAKSTLETGVFPRCCPVCGSVLKPDATQCEVDGMTVAKE